MADNVSITARVPVRIDFAGGWTDVHHFSAREGGAVFNAAISLYVRGTAALEGGRIHVEYGSTIPAGSGLGTSAALDVAWLALTSELMDRRLGLVELAEGAYKLEKLLGVEGGKQDQYAAALGGFNLLEFGAEEQPARVVPAKPSAETVRDLLDRSVLCYSGSSRSSDQLHRRVWERYLGGDPDVAKALHTMARTAAPAYDALTNGNVGALAYFLTENRECARRLEPGLITPHMDALFRAAEEAGAAGGKACGAGGGGCLYFICDEGKRPDVEAALRAADVRILPFRFEPHAA